MVFTYVILHGPASLSQFTPYITIQLQHDASCIPSSKVMLGQYIGTILVCRFLGIRLLGPCWDEIGFQFLVLAKSSQHCPNILIMIFKIFIFIDN